MIFWTVLETLAIFDCIFLRTITSEDLIRQRLSVMMTTVGDWMAAKSRQAPSANLNFKPPSQVDLA